MEFAVAIIIYFYSFPSFLTQEVDLNSNSKVAMKRSKVTDDEKEGKEQNQHLFCPLQSMSLLKLDEKRRKKK